MIYKSPNVEDVLSRMGTWYEKRVNTSDAHVHCIHADKENRRFNYPYYCIEDVDSDDDWVLMENDLWCVRLKDYLRLAELKGIRPKLYPAHAARFSPSMLFY